ncbi:glycosyltransferase family 4 protein [Proteiniphilum sp. X52]|uniref:glycosyltransferase family 4 protein n=1 Tax=Proteiniphilum sp. X52 TaxID=2382159 RepID=UPI000F09ECEE|nr:glycosyltransferase [Proteiniphilum sp. X52]RNC64747.1 glycosyltransferase family 1 protein [Proteiniphilum sp. X52]
MRTLWVCNFSNAEIRDELVFKNSLLDRIMRVFFKKPRIFSDYGIWISNGIKAFESCSTNIELFIISPHYGLKSKIQSFKKAGITYFFFKPNDDTLLQKTFLKRNNQYRQNRNIIKDIVADVRPDIIHFYGAENPRYSIAAIDIDTEQFPVLVSLQTLMSPPSFYAKYPISKKEYDHRVKIEQAVLRKATFIGSPTKEYTEYVWRNINSEAIITDSFLFLQQEFPIINVSKNYDFVYFAAGIEKAIDIVLTVVSIVVKKHRNVLVNVIGGCSPESLEKINKKVEDLEIKKNIVFSGMLPEHKDVLLKIQESKFAILPLKVDNISGTIREAMFAGLPVVTTITDGTPLLNEKRQSVLLSKHDDYESMADNMIRLIENPNEGEVLKKNAFITVHEMWDNNHILKKLLKVYECIHQNRIFKKELPSEYFILNKTKI